MNTTPPPSQQSTLQLKVDWRIVSAVLLVAILAMLAFWQPWRGQKASKTISVQGQATVTQVPDSYTFTPFFQGDDTAAVTAKGNEAVAQIKKLGVKDTEIKTSVNSAERPIPLDARGAAETTTSLIYPYPYGKSTYAITVNVKDKALAQKIADYLATTSATGQITPLATLSTESRNKLELQARSKASDDAKAKAEVMAKQLGAKVGKVVSVSESGGGFPYKATIAEDTSRGSSPSTSTSGPTIEPGTEDLTYTATVVFELK